MPGEIIAENNISDVAEDKSEAKELTPTSKPVIGIIYPPPEVRNIVDKTASFVARNGPEFEARICQKEINNSKFNFLKPGDPYNAYYQHKVKEFREGKTAPEVGPVQPVKPKQQDVQKILEKTFIPKEPPAEFEFIADPPSISAFDLDVVKLTAQFVARNGRQFLTNLMNREQRNFQFDFLRPQHSLFNYFTKLLEQYTKVLIPPKDLMNKLKKEAIDPKSVLEQVEYRVQWTKLIEAQKRREEEEAERERIAYAQIDWHDFVIVETVDYQPFEQGQFPPPTTPEEVGTRVLAQERFEELGDDVEMEVESDQELSEAEDDKRDTNVDNTQVQDMEEDSSDDDERPSKSKAPSPPPQPTVGSAPQPPPLPPNPEQVLIRKDYDPKASKHHRAPTSDEYLISPITGERIPVNKVQEHMRIGLLDPRWVEQRDRAIQEKMQQEEVYAAGSAIESSLKQLAERRTDIFGVGDEETAIGKKIGEEDKRREEKVTWDGHTASMEAATRAARANITIEEQIHQIHKVKGLLPDEEKERIGPSKPQSSTPIQPAKPPVPPPGTAPVKPPPPPPPTPSTTSATINSSSTVTPAPAVPPPTGTMPPAIAPITAIPQPILAPQGMMLVGPRPPVGPPPLGPPSMLGESRELLFPYGLAPRPLVPPRPPLAPGVPPQPPYPSTPAPPAAPPLPPVPPPPDDEPPTKKQKTEETLISEAEFLRKHTGPVTFKVQVPNISDKPEWKLNGQILALTLPLTDMVSVIKAKLHEQIGMPPGKQKLHYEGLFFKDSNSLAYYNMLPTTVVQLQLKERGGRKK